MILLLRVGLGSHRVGVVGDCQLIMSWDELLLTPDGATVLSTDLLNRAADCMIEASIKTMHRIDPLLVPTTDTYEAAITALARCEHDSAIRGPYQARLGSQGIAIAAARAGALAGVAYIRSQLPEVTMLFAQARSL